MINGESKESTAVEVNDSAISGKLLEGFENSSLFKDAEDTQTEGGNEKTAEQLAEEEAAKKAAESSEEETDEQRTARETEEAEAARKSEQQQQQSSGEDEDDIILTAKTRLGVEDLEDDFEETVDGLLDLAEKAIEKKAVEAKTIGVNEFLERKPILKAIDEHLESGGTLVSLIQQKQVEDFSKLEIGEDDTELAERLYRTELQTKGIDEEDIESMVNTAKDTGKLIVKGTNAKAYLVKSQEAIVNAQIAKEQADAKAERDKQIAIENEVRKVIKSGNINGLKLDATGQAELEKFALDINPATKKPIRDEAYEALTHEQWLLLDRIVMNGFKGLGITPKTVTGKPLKELKKTTKTVDITSSGGGSKLTETLGISGIKDLLGN